MGIHVFTSILDDKVAVWLYSRINFSSKRVSSRHRNNFRASKWLAQTKSLAEGGGFLSRLLRLSNDQLYFYCFFRVPYHTYIAATGLQSPPFSRLSGGGIISNIPKGAARTFIYLHLDPRRKEPLRPWLLLLLLLLLPRT